MEMLRDLQRIARNPFDQFSRPCPPLSYTLLEKNLRRTLMATEMSVSGELSVIDDKGGELESCVAPPMSVFTGPRQRVN